MAAKPRRMVCRAVGGMKWGGMELYHSYLTPRREDAEEYSFFDKNDKQVNEIIITLRSLIIVICTLLILHRLLVHFFSLW